MKLLIILSIAEYEDEVRALMVKNNVPIYSETEMYGFRTEKHQPDIRSWFTQADQGIYSTLFFSFQDEQTVKKIMDAVQLFNNDVAHNADNPLHAYQIPVEAFA